MSTNPAQAAHWPALQVCKHHSIRLPGWVGTALARALHPDAARRFNSLSKFQAAGQTHKPEDHHPLAERDPVQFWRTVSVILVFLLILAIGLEG
ncbi:MAG: hypothetical protein ACFB11_02275 [Paracoccaceae bacterium]